MEDRKLVSSTGDDQKQPLKGKKMHNFKLFVPVYMQYSCGMRVREDDHAVKMF